MSAVSGLSEDFHHAQGAIIARADMVRLCCCATLLLAAISASIGCSKSPSEPSPVPESPVPAALSIVGLTARVSPLTTTPQPGLVYQLIYQVRESGGQTGARLTTLRFSFSNGVVADGTFTTARVEPGASTSLVSSYSVYPASNPADRVEFLIGYVDDRGNSGSAVASADITRVGF